MEEECSKQKLKKLILHDNASLPANDAGLLQYGGDFLLLEIDKNKAKPRRNRRIVFLQTITKTIIGERKIKRSSVEIDESMFFEPA
ncbi:unnamed protein product, partial [Mesorhabditis spiculigera]